MKTSEKMEVDMSPKAVKNKIKMVSQLHRLSIALGKAKKETEARKKIENKLSKKSN